MKQRVSKKILLVGLSSVFFMSCTSDEDPVNPVQPEAVTKVRMIVDDFFQSTASALPTGESSISEIEAYLFQNDTLKKCLGPLSSSGGDTYELNIMNSDKGDIYFIANTEGHVDVSGLEEGTTLKSEFLQLASKLNDDQTRLKGNHILTGSYQRQKTGSAEVNLQRGVARLDLTVNVPQIKIKSVRIDNVSNTGYVFKQSGIETPVDVEKRTIRRDFPEPLTASETGLFYLYEQNNAEMNLTMEIEADGKSNTLSAQLPESLSRNKIYTLTVNKTGTEDFEITINVTTSVEEWIPGEDVTATPDSIVSRNV
ncbi:fimbrillin family protein [Parabacteroides sp. AGMB00274]|uniref:Fimbrillin family protein n=1 Tax=Parabacteroides faecalis TaxID=2924040 RepID=A0ABT0C0N3_9BACT|nr:fimbrillin family protein [Parabacteroides faecalis]MCI7285224.1 fimbrillin family protein [Parabacteroides sp.]MCJ2380572.1 fimbrillin family protein [Parabacteroides faecalis]MDY6254464.1 fimbrillin family protein [Bacteroidales bacterium]